jgi:hypothetical protein
MKFLYADSLDFVDPNYRFLEDRSAPGRETYWDDEFAHQYLGEAPFDGLLVSRGVVGDHKFSGKYTQSQAMRFRRDGMRKFMRLEDPQYDDLMLMGDCGAFSYKDLDKPPYTPSEILEFYEDAGFTHGCSVDHLIFDFERDLKGLECLPNPKDDPIVKKRMDTIWERFYITEENANAFYKESAQIPNFTPMGVVQGWSPGSMAEAARSLVSMGYNYLAIGGMVPLNAESIKLALSAIRELIPDYTRLHILGFGKIDYLKEFESFNITSIDTTSPMLRAFKDSRKNFFMPGAGDQLKYYTAIRIPQATINRGLNVLVKKGHFTQEFLLRQEKDALQSVRDLDQGKGDVKSTLQAVMAYTKSHLINPKTGDDATETKLSNIEADYLETLTDKPWKKCPCEVCKKVSVEGAIFRASNRNKRRGMHNMWVFYQQLKKLTGQEYKNGHPQIHSDSRATK